MLRAYGHFPERPQPKSNTLAGSARDRATSLPNYDVRAPAMSSPPSQEAPPATYASPAGDGPWQPSPRGTVAAAVSAAPDAKRFRHDEPARWTQARDAASASGSMDWMEGATPVVQLSNNAQMKMVPVKMCTECGQEGHCVQEGCPAAAAAAPRPEFSRVQPETGPAPVPLAHWGRPAQPERTEEPEAAAAAAAEPASSSGDHHGASPAEQAGFMPPPPKLPPPKMLPPYTAPSYSDAQIRYSEANGGGLGSAGTAPSRRHVHPGYVRYQPRRSEDAAPEPNPSEAPEVPDVPAAAYGIGTYDAYQAGRRDAVAEAKGKCKGKSKGKSKKGKDSESSHSRNQTGWWNRDLWKYERGE